MKKHLLTTVLIAISFFAAAQTSTEEVDLVQSVFGMEKKAMVAEFVKLQGAQADAFWKVYDEYEVERKQLGKKRIDLLSRYASGYGTMDDAATDAIITDMTKLSASYDKLMSSYYKKMKKAAGVKPAAQFYQFEGYVLSKMRAEIMENIPLIGEFDK
jgi:hypothetical protein